MIWVCLLFVSSLQSDEYAAAKQWIQQENGFSGPGSLDENTEGVRVGLQRILHDYDIRTIVDACGDWRYMNTSTCAMTYHGYDIGETIVARNTRRYASDSIKFGVLNILTHVPPQADLVIVREFLFHIKPEVGKRAVDHIRQSKSKYLLTTTHSHVTRNRNPEDKWGYGDAWGYYDVNVELPPFNLTQA